ncbi:MAG: hypothetical protein RI959_2009, partial [Pseudomonadota bacterium]
MNTSTSVQRLSERARPLTPEEEGSIPWRSSLSPDEWAQVCGTLVVTLAQPGDYICRVGRQVTYWFGLIDGLLKMSNDDSQGPIMTFTGIAPGGWFGEGTVLKRET